ncbi:MAG TPA: adenylate cyclase regulatory domain-containing protein [Candidatus Dormibacteraeota bacterium]|nr:adenylate cyclase regulatory domain-containing protein [Candidatus Dormibacteraeota bacterium]
MKRWRRLGTVERGLVRLVPARLVRGWVRLWAPLSRYGGRTRHGAAVMSRAMTLLGEPPRPLSPIQGTIGLADIAARVGRSEEDVARWADRGLLGPPKLAGPPREWGREALERARLIVYLLRRGVGEDAMAEAAAHDRLPLLVVELALGRRGTLTKEQAARHAGVPLELAERVWRAIGMPKTEANDRIYTRQDVEALRIIAALRGLLSDADIVENAAVIGRGMAQIAGAQVEMFRRRVGMRFAEAGSGDLEWALRAAAIVDLIRRPAAVTLEQAYRIHLDAAAQAESVATLERATASIPGQVDIAVAFADLVGFTALSEELSPLEVGELASTLVSVAEDVLGEHGGRLVKSNGDGVMYTARTAIAACSASLALVEALRAHPEMPEVRVGVAFGRALRRQADYFGRTVNVASRLCDAAPAGTVLVLAAGVDPSAAAWREAGLGVGQPLRLRLKGIEGEVDAIPVTRAGQAA